MNFNKPIPSVSKSCPQEQAIIRSIRKSSDKMAWRTRWQVMTKVPNILQGSFATLQKHQISAPTSFRLDQDYY